MSGKQIFVFGSNLAGRHGAGSAKEAVEKHGARYGRGRGYCGNSYAIPTKGHNLEVLSLKEIGVYVDVFRMFAMFNHDMVFNVVKIGCGLAGYTEDQIKPLFRNMPKNVNLPEGWR